MGSYGNPAWQHGIRCHNVSNRMSRYLGAGAFGERFAV